MSHTMFSSDLGLGSVQGLKFSLTSLVTYNFIMYVPDLLKLPLFKCYPQETSDSQEVFPGHSNEFLTVIFLKAGSHKLPRIKKLENTEVCSDIQATGCISKWMALFD